MRKVALAAIAVGVGLVGGAYTGTSGAQPVAGPPAGVDAMVSALGQVAGTSMRGAQPGAAVSIPADANGWSSTIEGRSGVEAGVLETQLEGTAERADGATVTSVARLTSTACPDQRGRVQVEVTIDVSESGFGNPTREHRTIGFTGQVDDSARLVSIDGRVDSSVASSGGDQLVEWTGHSTARRRGRSLRGSVPRVEVGRAALRGAAEADARASTERAAELARGILTKTEALWRSGYCVEVRVLEGGSRAVDVNERVSIVAQPFHKLEGTELDTPVTSRLSGGAKRVTPPRANSPARFTYTGPPESPGEGTVELRSTSRRGIGTVVLTYTTGKDLKVTGSAYGGRYFGVKCDGPVGRWRIEGNAPGNPKRISNVTVRLDASGTGTYSVFDVYYTEGIEQPSESSEEGSGAVYDPAAKTLTFGYGDGYRFEVEQGSFCENGQPTGS